MLLLPLLSAVTLAVASPVALEDYVNSLEERGKHHSASVHS
jgi:hypothetical protein